MTKLTLRFFATAILLLVAIAVQASDTVSAETLAKQIQEQTAPFILDVRSEQEFNAGHVPGAVNIPHTKIRQFVQQIMAQQKQPVVVYCKSGYRAGIAEGILKSYGFSQLIALEGHMDGWYKQGLPVEK